MSIYQWSLTGLGLLLPTLLVVQAFTLSRRAKGWFAFAAALVLYLLAAQWLISALVTASTPPAQQELRNNIVLEKGVLLYLAMAVTAELMARLPTGLKATASRWASWRQRRKTQKTANR